ncbi:MAG: transcriptional repressor [Thermodesulfobacteriales bacterium]|nr:MAG: transcriptional repressor [Thermodesulfobacteriales bacterium]
MFSVEKSKEIKSMFHDKGFKCTPQRLAVLKVLQDTSAYLSINTIHLKVKEFLPDTGLATVYRSLETLVDLNLVVKVHLEDGCHSYVIAPEGHRHPIVCTDCNKVIEFAEFPLDDLSKQISEDTGVQIKTHFLQLFGKCKECQA